MSGIDTKAVREDADRNLPDGPPDTLTSHRAEADDALSAKIAFLTAELERCRER